jgi:hypothetical protein
VPPSEDEIRRRLAEFAARWGGYQGSERAEAQTFLNELLACYGVDRQAAGVRFEEHRAGGFMDLFWPGVCIVEMKRPSEAPRLADHRAQALQYWQQSGTPRSPAPRYVVLCASLSGRDALGEIGRRLVARRSEICHERQIGLTTLYNEVDDGAHRDLRELHIALDEAVAAAYGWPASAAHDSADSNRRLLELNRAIVAGEVPYHPFD